MEDTNQDSRLAGSRALFSKSAHIYTSSRSIIPIVSFPLISDVIYCFLNFVYCIIFTSDDV